MRRSALIVLLSACSMLMPRAGAALAEPFTEAIAAYKVGDYAAAQEWFLALANAGNRTAQFYLGVMYAYGQAGPQNRPEAAKWYRRAAEQGHAGAQYMLGVRYHLGEDVAQDYVEAARWYRLAADQGVADAQYSLGGLYNSGKGVPQDYAEAARLNLRAAEQGHASAQGNLGFMYGAGHGVEQDYVEAHKWYSLAAANFAEAEADRRDRAIKFRGELAVNMSAAQIAQAQMRASLWRPTPAPALAQARAAEGQSGPALREARRTRVGDSLP